MTVYMNNYTKSVARSSTLLNLPLQFPSTSPHGKQKVVRPRRRWEDNIKIDLREIGFEDVRRTEVVQDSV
jgi:hypothetical protein